MLPATVRAADGVSTAPAPTCASMSTHSASTTHNTRGRRRSDVICIKQADKCAEATANATACSYNSRVRAQAPARGDKLWAHPGYPLSAAAPEAQSGPSFSAHSSSSSRNARRHSDRSPAPGSRCPPRARLGLPKSRGGVLRQAGGAYSEIRSLLETYVCDSCALR